MNRKIKRVIGVSLLILTLTAATATQFASAMTLKKVTSWMWGLPGGQTFITSTATGDVDGDGDKEIVTGGYFMQYTADTYEAQLCVWDALTLALEKVQPWLWGQNTVINSVALGDVDGDGNAEIVTGGDYFTNANYGQLCVWNGATLALENVISWKFPQESSYISAVAFGDVDADGKGEIVTANNMGSKSNPHTQVAVWDGATLALKRDFTPAGFVNYFWINSIALGCVDGDSKTEIVEGGYFEIGGVKRAILLVFDGATLEFDNSKAWEWSATSTVVNSVAIGNVDGLYNIDGSQEIVTGGSFFDGTREIAQLVVWNGKSLNVNTMGGTSGVQVWDWGGTGSYGTQITSVSIGDVDGSGWPGPLEIVTGGFWYNNGYSAQLCVWNGLTLALKGHAEVWKWSVGTSIDCTAVGDVDGDYKGEMVTGGWWYDYNEYEFWTQLCVWDW